MYREPGMPVYLRAPSRALVTISFLAFGCLMVYLGVLQSWVLVLVLCFGVAVTLLALARMEWAILGLVAMSNFDGFLKPLFAERFSLFFKDYFVLLALVRWLWGLLAGEQRPSLRTGLAIPAALFIGYAVAELGNPNAPSVLAGLAGLRAWIIWIPVFFIAYDYMRSKAEIERLWVFATAISGIVAAYGIVQYFIGLEHLYALSPRFEVYARSAYVTASGERITRVIGTMVHAGTFGGAMGFMALVGSGIAFASRSRAARLLAIICVPVVVVGMFLSGSRAAMIVAAVGLLLFVVLARRPVLLLGAGLLILVSFWQATRVTGGAVEERLESATWEYSSIRVTYPFVRGLNMALAHPFGLGIASGIGVGGFGLQPGSYKGAFLENDFGRALGELGIGALLYCLLLAAAVLSAARAYLRTADESSSVLSAALIGALAGPLIGLAAGASLYLVPGAIYFWLALASVLRLGSSEDGIPGTSTPPVEAQAPAAQAALGP